MMGTKIRSFEPLPPDVWVRRVYGSGAVVAAWIERCPVSFQGFVQDAMLAARE